MSNIKIRGGYFLEGEDENRLLRKPEFELILIDLTESIEGKVAKIPGKGLSKNDFTDVEKK